MEGGQSQSVLRDRNKEREWSQCVVRDRKSQENEEKADGWASEKAIGELYKQ